MEEALVASLLRSIRGRETLSATPCVYLMTWVLTLLLGRSFHVDQGSWILTADFVMSIDEHQNDWILYVGSFPGRTVPESSPASSFVQRTINFIASGPCGAGLGCNLDTCCEAPMMRQLRGLHCIGLLISSLLITEMLKTLFTLLPGGLPRHYPLLLCIPRTSSYGLVNWSNEENSRATRYRGVTSNNDHTCTVRIAHKVKD